MIHLISGVQLKWILTTKELTFCLLTVKQDATWPSTAWKGSPLLFAWDEWTDCQPIKNLPKDYWMIGKAKLKNSLLNFPKFQLQFQFSKICFVIYGSKANLIKKKSVERRTYVRLFHKRNRMIDSNDKATDDRSLAKGPQYSHRWILKVSAVERHFQEQHVFLQGCNTWTWRLSRFGNYKNIFENMNRPN